MVYERTPTVKGIVIIISVLVASGMMVGFAGAKYIHYSQSENNVGSQEYTEDEYSEEANFTWEVWGTEDAHEPGAEGVGHKFFLFHDENLEVWEYAHIYAEFIDLSKCGVSDVRAFGIDRNDTYEGTKTDESLLDKYRDADFGEDKVWFKLNRKEDVGEHTYLNDTDEALAANEGCNENPDEPGWYRMEGKINGTDWNGEHSEAVFASNYVYFCEGCESRSDARQELGPPPSEDSTTPTQTPEDQEPATQTPEDQEPATQTPEDQEPATQTPEDQEPATQSPEDQEPATQTTAEMATDQAQDEDEGTPADGPGFNHLIALLAILISALIIRINS